MNRGGVIAAVLVMLCLASLAAGAEAGAPSYGPHVRAATLDTTNVQESSGVAGSPRRPDLLWTHNDSGGAPRVWRFG